MTDLLRPFRLLLPIAAMATFMAGCATDDAGASRYAAPALASFDDDDDDTPSIEDLSQLTVRGVAEFEVPADEARFSIGVVTESDSAGDALEANNERMDEVVEALARAGLDETEYETGRFDVRPQYSRRPRGADEDWRPRILGYEVANSLAVRTTRIDLVGELIAAANDAGANTVEMHGFGLSDPERYRERSIREATAAALRDAGAMADAADLRIVRVLRLRLENADVPDGPRFRGGIATARSMQDAAPTIDAGAVTVRAAVTVVHEIAPRTSRPPGE